MAVWKVKFGTLPRWGTSLKALPHFIIQGKYTAGIGGQRFSHGSKRCTRAAAKQQRSANLCLKLRNALAYSRLANALAAGSLREIATVCNRQKYLQSAVSNHNMGQN